MPLSTIGGKNNLITMFLLIRQLRRKLLMENNIQKYFLYALGEIFLVVVGILLALQIDNWNDERIQRNEEKILISNLKDEFQENLLSLDDEIERLTYTRDGLIELLETLANRPENFTSNDMDTLLQKSFISPSWDPSSYVLTDLKNSGRLSTISNQRLKLQLFDWERHYESLITSTENYRIYSVDYYRYITKHGSIRNVDALFEQNEISKSSLNISNLPLLEQPEFENNTSNFHSLTTNVLKKYSEARNKMTEIIAAADEVE